MMAAPKQVAVSAALNGIPAASIIAGFTAMMYAMARNVVKAANDFVGDSAASLDILKNLSSM